MALESRNNVTPIEVKKVVLHTYPDLDADSSYWLALTYSQIGFLGIEKAPIEFWPQGPPPDGRTAEEHEKEGTVCFDTGEGRFDHHPHGKCPGKCGMDLVADFLGVSKDITLGRILGFVRAHDLDGFRSLSVDLRDAGCDPKLVRRAVYYESMTLPAIMSAMARKLGDKKRLIKLVCDILTELHQMQIHFWGKVSEEFKEKAKIWTVLVEDREYRIASIESEEREVGSFSRTNEGGFCDVCIHRDPSLGTFISGMIEPAQFNEIAKFLRVTELAEKDIEEEYELEELTVSRFRLDSTWYLPQNRAAETFIIMNGGRKTKGSQDILPTKLSLEKIEAAVVLGLDEGFLPEKCPRTRCLLNYCGFYRFGLARCERIREAEKEAAGDE